MNDRIQLNEITVTDYLSAVASDAPAPGGGSVTGVVAAMAAALGSMVGSMTIARSKTTVAPELPAAVAELTESITRLQDLAAQDARAYQGYIDATRLPKTTDTERDVRHAAQQDALLVAADVPMAVAEHCRTILITLTPIAHLGTRHALADCSVAAWLAVAAAHGGLINVRTNAGMMDDPTRKADYTRRADVIEHDLDDLRREVLAAVASRNKRSSDIR